MSIYVLYIYIYIYLYMLYISQVTGQVVWQVEPLHLYIYMSIYVYIYIIYIVFVVYFPGDGSGRLAGGATAYT